MNLMDVLIVTLFVVVAGCGFFFGVARTISTMIAVYLATVISATFYERFGNLIIDMIGAISESAAYFAAFVLLFVGITVLFTLVIISTIHPTSMKRRFAILDNLGGATISVGIAFVAITMSLAILVVIIQAAAAASGEATGGMMGEIRDQMETSTLAPLFLRLLPILTSTIQPWFPGGLPPILTEASTI
ncbi:MAG TPA: CvpA family protein [Thermomicrobiales bacterium]|nr:CvpA family protein [Thermomicrobiales bacterium]